jgi:hypothetical protein
MSEDGDAPQYVWESMEPVAEDAEGPETANWVKSAGRARVTYPNGDTFEGSFNDEKQKHGAGVYTWKPAGGGDEEEDGGDEDAEKPKNKYEGPYVSGKKHGLGQMWFTSGDRYHGMFEADEISGEGTYYYASGDLYSGKWEKGQKHGHGAFVFGKDDSQLVGEWEHGQLKSGKWVFKDGTVWTGAFKGNKPIGPGVFTFPNGNQQEGEYVEVGDPDDEEAEMKLVWRGGPVTTALVDAADITRAPLPKVA